MIWDTEVDVLCVGTGAGALATAIAAADVDAEVVIATSAAQLSEFVDTGSWLPVTGDSDTDQYLASLMEGLTAAGVSPAASVPLRGGASRPPKTRTVATFSGAHVVDWGSQCLGAPTAALFSTVRGWTVVNMTDADGRPLLVAPVGVCVGPAELSVDGLHRALVSAVADRDIEIALQSPLRRLVFDGGAVVGAVVGLPDDEWAVGIRHGVVLAPEVTSGGVELSMPSDTADYRMALVSIPGSRFARVELLDAKDLEAGGSN